MKFEQSPNSLFLSFNYKGLSGHVMNDPALFGEQIAIVIIGFQKQIYLDNPLNGKTRWITQYFNKIMWFRNSNDLEQKVKECSIHGIESL